MTALCGFIFYLAVGGNLLHYKHLGSVEKGFGAMSILTGFIFGADTVISVLKLRKDDWVNQTWNTLIHVFHDFN